MLTFNFKAQTSEMDSKLPTKNIYLQYFSEGEKGGEVETEQKHNQTLKQEELFLREVAGSSPGALNH